jgi:hypothetical protein
LAWELEDIMNRVALIAAQTEAYNSRNLDAFVAKYADNVRIYRMPDTQPVLTGKSQLRAEYTERFRLPHLRAEILGRLVIGNKVLEHERVHGIGDAPIEAVAVYEVDFDLIQNVWFFFGTAALPQAMQANRQ